MTTHWVPIIGVVVLGMLGMTLHRPHVAASRPGDCLQTPVVDEGTLERWEEPQFERLVMVTEVGKTRYRTKDWGRDLTPRYPQWYPDYRDRPIVDVDNRAVWQPVPCPEQGEDPEAALRLQDPPPRPIVFEGLSWSLER